MNAIPADTTVEAVRKQFEILRRLGPEGRLKMAFEMSDNLRRIVEAGVIPIQLNKCALYNDDL